MFPLIFSGTVVLCPPEHTPGLCNSDLTQMCCAYGLEQLAGLVQEMELVPKSGSLLLSSQEGHCPHQGFLLSWDLLPVDEDIFLESTESQCFLSGQETSQCP